MSNLKYLTPQKPITEIMRERAEQAEQQNVDLYEAVAGLYEELGAAYEQIAALEDRVAKIEEGGK
ncbi:hypothetical protein SDC9_85681 [bioreactor metagenome]|uniref:Uncharacterized protein n=1 Tax=bioreactor metagenome TaxID=1076179 RepID=A0A644ZDV4_9ZZZZ|nr:transcription factor [Clostridia bacterium]